MKQRPKIVVMGFRLGHQIILVVFFGRFCHTLGSANPLLLMEGGPLSFFSAIHVENPGRKKFVGRDFPSFLGIEEIQFPQILRQFLILRNDKHLLGDSHLRRRDVDHVIREILILFFFR